MCQVSRHPRMMRLALQIAVESGNAPIRNAAATALILLDNLGRGRRSRQWSNDFARCCHLAGVA